MEIADLVGKLFSWAGVVVAALFGKKMFGWLGFGIGIPVGYILGSVLFVIVLYFTRLIIDKVKVNRGE